LIYNLPYFDVRHYGADPTGTDDSTEAVQDAVTAALAAGGVVLWSHGTYLTTASIDDLHSVRHRGPGIIQRGSDLFYAEPKYGQTNRLYVATTGSASNDGLSSSQPLVEPQDAFDALRNYGPVLNGS